MAVYTEVSDDELVGFVESYGLGELLSYKGIAEGVENTNYIVYTVNGPYFLTLYEKRVNGSDLPFFLGLMDFMSKEGLSCPTPVRDKNQAMLRSLAGRPAAFITFLQGMHVKRPMPEHCQELGAALADFHQKGLGFDQKRDNSLSVEGWRPLFDKIGKQMDDMQPSLYDKIAQELDFLEQNWPSNLPRGIIHADLFPDNVFFLQNKVSGLIDFYFSCYDMLAYDIAICLNAWCFEHDWSFNVTKAHALLSAYNSVREIQPEEVAALPILARGASMRFLLTRAYDWINTSEDALVSRKDPSEYIRKLSFHQHVKSPQEYGIASI